MKIHACDSSHRTSEVCSTKTTDSHEFSLLNKYGLLDSPSIAQYKHVQEFKKLCDASSAKEAEQIYKRPDMQRKNSNLSLMTYAIITDLPHIALLLLDAGHSIEKIDNDRLKTQLKMLDQQKMRLIKK